MIFPSLKQYELKNIYSKINGKKKPIAIRFDINSPVGKNGRISMRDSNVNLRLEENGYLLRTYSKLSPLVLMGHQGRKPLPNKKPDKNFVNFFDHHLVLAEISDIKVHFVEYLEGESWSEYSQKVEKQIKPLKAGEAVLMDNLRIWDFEKKFNPETCPLITFFEDLGLAAYINDAIPLWHRDDSSLMFGRYVAPTFIGHISMKELRIQHKIIQDKGKKVIIIGGKKPKFNTIHKLVDKMQVLTGGITGILTAQLSGYDIGSSNEKLLKENFIGKERQIREYATLIDEYEIGYPVDFVLSQRDNTAQSNRYNVHVNDLTKPKYEGYEIFDIGPKTVKKYVRDINEGGYDWKIRAGPNGVFEDEFNNGINLIEHLIGTGFVAIGGDTVEELQKYKLCKPIMYSGGEVLLGGGSHLEGFAGNLYPSIQDLIEHGYKKT